MARTVHGSLVVFIICILHALIHAKELTCNDCITSNTSLLIKCENRTSNYDFLCADSVRINCTLSKNCSGNINPTSSSASLLPTSTLLSTSMTTSSSSALHSTTLPHPTPTTKPPNTRHPSPKPKTPGRRFDAASFIGGILLCGGLILLVYIAVRCYKTKPNYSRL